MIGKQSAKLLWLKKLIKNPIDINPLLWRQ